MGRNLNIIPDPARLEVAITVELYDRLSQSDQSYIHPEALAEGLPIAPGLLRPLARRAKKNGYYDFDNEGDFILTEAGIDLILGAYGNPDSPVTRYLQSGDAWTMDPGPPPEEGNPTSDSWAPLPIDREASDYAEMVEATETALAEIEQNNGFSASEPEERDAIVFAIKGTLNAVKESKPSRGYVISGLLAPLRYVADKFAGASIGELASAAVSAVLSWLASI